jgi:hypothetical protein
MVYGLPQIAGFVLYISLYLSITAYFDSTQIQVINHNVRIMTSK